jgi:hypothetical protein
MRTASIRARSAAALWARTPSRPDARAGPVPQHIWTCSTVQLPRNRACMTCDHSAVRQHGPGRKWLKYSVIFVWQWQVSSAESHSWAARYSRKILITQHITGKSPRVARRSVAPKMPLSRRVPLPLAPLLPWAEGTGDNGICRRQGGSSGASRACAWLRRVHERVRRRRAAAGNCRDQDGVDLPNSACACSRLTRRHRP